MQSSDSPLRDEDLVRSTLRGSQEAFGFLVVRYSRSVRAVLLTRIGNHRDLDDLVQECFLRAYKGLSKLRKPSSFKSYLRRIARNICTDWLRKRDREPSEIELDEVDFAIASPTEAESPIAERLRTIVGRLPFALREAVMMFYFESMDIQEMAEVLGITPASVSQRLARARQRMGEDLRVEAT